VAPGLAALAGVQIPPAVSGLILTALAVVWRTAAGLDRVAPLTAPPVRGGVEDPFAP
jgi:hypothetical protein